jgi:hypothetical protein
MNNLQLAIVYAKTAAAALGFISSTSHLSPRRRIEMTVSDDSLRNEGRQGGGPIRGRNRGRVRPDHGFTQRGGSTTRTWGANPYHNPRDGRVRGSPVFNQNRSPSGGRGGNYDETFIPRNLFDHCPQHSSQYFYREGMRITLMMVLCNRIISHMIAQLGMFSGTSRLLLLDLHLTEMEILIVLLMCQQAHNLVEAHAPDKVGGEVPL